MKTGNRTSRLLKWVVLAAAILVIIAVASFWMGGGSFSPSGVTLTLAAPDRASSGDQLIYAVRWENGTKLTLTNLTFRLFYPEGSIVLDENNAPTTPDSAGFTVDSLAPGESASKSFPVYLIGDKGAIKTARVHLVYNAGTLQSSFEADTTAATTIIAVPVNVSVVTPPTATSGQAVQYIVDVRNDTADDLTDLKLKLQYPDGFSVQSMQPQPSQGNTLWVIDTLKAGTGKRFTISGTLIGNEQETKTVTATLQRNLNGQYVDYVRADAFTMLSSPLLSVSVWPNDGPDYVAHPGDTLRYTVSYRNSSPYTLLGLSLAVALEGDMYDTANLRVDNGSFDDATNTVTFNASGVPAFAQLGPNTSGQVTFSVPLKASFTGGSSGSFFVKATARLSTPNVPSGLDQSEVAATNAVITKISSQPALSAAVLYDNGAGSGPLPPKVGSVTTYTIRWQLNNPGNDIRNAKVTAVLPPGVTWVGVVGTVVGGTAPAFNPNSSTVTWAIGTVPFGTGSGMPRMEASFQVSIRPSSNQVGQSVPLTSQSTLSGTDSFTGQAVTAPLRTYTTDDTENHSDDGRVVAQ